MSSDEIEDVVSSVRRLVSNEQSSRRTTRDLAADRLLLTPSLRVVSEIATLSTLILDAPVPEEVFPPEPVVEPAPEAAAAPSPLAEEIAPAATEEPAVELIVADWEDEIWAAPEAVSLGEAALGAEEAEVLLPPSEDHPVAPPAEQAPEAAAEADREAEAESWAQVDGEWVEDEPVPFIPLRRRAEHLAARLAAGVALDPEEAEDADLDEPPVQPLREVAAELLEDDPLAADLDGDAPVARGIDDGEASGPAQRMPTEILDADGTPLAVLDEAALQEIVRQMIREELQGALGERITRNVRKLVRAEINRALVARDLD
ncbi:hypothetical protein [Tabrizicola sp.]|uniref:hypothetical protein n=1 Tax=Tabrizicola sp. TaxID=2005166 RepID=UPI0025FC0E5C|nr:hypothetical protein [Tabrizicola sp.]